MKEEYLRTYITNVVQKNLFIGHTDIYQLWFERSIFKILSNQKLRCLLDSLLQYDKSLIDHSINTAILTMYLAIQQKIPLEITDELTIAAAFHDIGKLFIPKQILYKPDRLTEDEWQIMQLHPSYGYATMRPLPVSSLVLDVISYHHCGHSFKGYPKSISSEPHQWQLIQIVTLADSFDAMSSKRCYRQNLPLSFIYKEISANIGTQFEPIFGKCLLGIIENFASYPKRGELQSC